MPLCSSGITQQKPGTADDIILTSAILEAMAAGYGFGWLLAPFIGAAASTLNLHLPSFCASDPPVDPGVSGADLLALATIGPGPLTADAADRVTQLLERYAWYTFCECASVTTPAAPAPPSQPSGTPAIDPGQQVGYPAVQPCMEYGIASLTVNVGGGLNVNTFLYKDFDGTNFGAPINVTSMQCKLTVTQTTGSGSSVRIRFQQQDANSVVVQTDTKLVVNGTTNSLLVQRNALSVNVFVDLLVTGGSGSVTWSNAYFDLFCDGQQPNGVASPCCPPDPILSSKLDVLLQMVTLIQRQSVPFAYLTGTVHSGLTGTGSIAVTGILGVLLNVSAPVRAGVDVGTPDTNWDLGWINFGDSNGYEDRIWLRGTSQILIPPTAGLFTVVGYTLTPGVTLALTELVREP